MKQMLIVAASLTMAGAAWAGDQYVNATGYANSGYDVVAYFDLPQAPVGQEQPAAVPGSTAFTATYNGATFAFSSARNLARFEADPARYAPQFDGHCAYGVAKGGKVPGSPELWRIVDNKLYLNITPVVVGFWNEDISGNLDRAENNWSGIEPEPASGMAIPKFTPAAPVAN
ncbi:YHS domain-containing (seleno)protein [Acuticoccus sp. MNP-M23]|uniref:YHS domain-containing (seleno)protein n=1 Tax=Acuticoccus sp. MNP-M23 TaxID=3072793 RepID=UPI002814CB40|nr:YHS domain-containing (seleno)protein [Acuticoccus sp. MNP-M23]WMS44839.1 YHS domain-containing (seleno)protein [Acuticoccus sp. MNP-M23]